jgi:hypothetical protein
VASPETDVAGEVLDRQRAELVARPLARLRDATEADERLPASLAGLHASSDVAFDLLPSLTSKASTDC